MGIRILSGTRINEGDGTTGAVLYDSVTLHAFGPVLTDTAEAEAFLAWAFPRHGDVRQYSGDKVEDLVVAFRASKRRPA